MVALDVEDDVGVPDDDEENAAVVTIVVPVVPVVAVVAVIGGVLSPLLRSSAI